MKLKDLYKLLGVNKDAKKSEIKKAYREKAKVHHPDINKDSKDFADISMAYKILIDDEKRKYYDETGTVFEKKDDKAISTIYGIFNSIIEDGRCDIKMHDVIRMVKQRLKVAQGNMHQTIKQCEEQKEKYKDILKRIKTESKENMFLHFMEDKISNIEYRIKNINEDIEISNTALDILSQYSYEHEQERDIFKDWRTSFSIRTHSTSDYVIRQ